MLPVMPVAVGEIAPDFVLKDQNNQDVRLSDFRAYRPVLLVFYPLAFTGVCASELHSLSDLGGVQVLTVSVDSVYAHKVWADREGFTVPLLADFWPHGAVASGVRRVQRGAGVRGARHVHGRLWTALCGSPRCTGRVIPVAGGVERGAGVGRCTFVSGRFRPLRRRAVGPLRAASAFAGGLGLCGGLGRFQVCRFGPRLRRNARYFVELRTRSASRHDHLGQVSECGRSLVLHRSLPMRRGSGLFGPTGTWHR